MSNGPAHACIPTGSRLGTSSPSRKSSRTGCHSESRTCQHNLCSSAQSCRYLHVVSYSKQTVLWYVSVPRGSADPDQYYHVLNALFFFVLKLEVFFDHGKNRLSLFLSKKFRQMDYLRHACYTNHNVSGSPIYVR